MRAHARGSHLSDAPSGGNEKGPSPVRILVSFLGAVVGIALLSAITEPSAETASADRTKATDPAVANLVRQELHKMFLAESELRNRTIRSGYTQPGASVHVELSTGDGAVSLRCYGSGRVSVTSLALQGTRSPHPDFSCSTTALLRVVGDGTLAAIDITPHAPDTWVSWALAHPTSSASGSS